MGEMIITDFYAIQSTPIKRTKNPTTEYTRTKLSHKVLNLHGIIPPLKVNSTEPYFCLVHYHYPVYRLDRRPLPLVLVQLAIELK